MRLAASTAGLVVAAVTADSGFSLDAVGQVAPVARDCSSSVYGDLGSDWMQSSIVAGPLAFVHARGYSSSRHSFASLGGGRYRPTKLLAVVRTGWVARLVVPAAQRRKVALRYSPTNFNEVIAPAEGAHDATFTACPPGRPFLGPKTAR